MIFRGKIFSLVSRLEFYYLDYYSLFQNDQNYGNYSICYPLLLSFSIGFYRKLL